MYSISFFEYNLVFQFTYFFFSDLFQTHREFYKSNDMRPPFTYASLIRQVFWSLTTKQISMECTMIMYFVSGYNGMSPKAIDVERHLHLVSVVFWILSSQCSHLEGKWARHSKNLLNSTRIYSKLTLISFTECYSNEFVAPQMFRPIRRQLWLILDR